jgi:hypothetical protein
LTLRRAEPASAEDPGNPRAADDERRHAAEPGGGNADPAPLILGHTTVVLVFLTAVGVGTERRPGTAPTL